MDMSITFSDTFSDDLNDPNSQAHADMNERANRALGEVVSNVGSVGDANWIYSSGSVNAFASNIQVSGVQPSIANVAQSVQNNPGATSDPSFTGATPSARK